MPRNVRPFCLIALALAAAAATPLPAPRAPGKALPESNRPSSMTLFLGGGIFPPNYRVVLKSDVLEYSAETVDPTDPKRTVRTARTVRPTPDQWRSFRVALDHADVWRWRPQYEAKGVADGTFWSVDLDWGGRHVVSSGRNRYPGGEGRESEAKSEVSTGNAREFEITREFDRFLAAVEALVAGPFR